MSNTKSNTKTAAGEGASAFINLETAENAVADAKAVAEVICDMLIPQSDGGQITLSAEGLVVLMQTIQDKCERASQALADLRPQALRTTP